MVVCKCVFVDGKDVDITVDKDANGSDLFQSICKYLNIRDPTPFGLVHRDGSKPSTYNWWIRMDRPLRKQITGKCQVWVFALVVKFYPKANVEQCEEITRFYSLLQVRDDLLSGRLPCPKKDLVTLAAYWAQSDYGEFSLRSVDQQIADAFRFVRPENKSSSRKDDGKDDEAFVDKMIETHKKLRRMTACDADIKFLKLASTLPTYGTHLYPAFEWAFIHQRFFPKRLPEFNDPVTVGLGYKGISLNQKNNAASRTLSWTSIHAVAFKKNLVIIKLNRELKVKERNNIYLAFDNLVQAKTVWRAAVDMHVHCRIQKKVQQAQTVSVKLKRRWTIVGARQATTVQKTTAPSRLSRLATISESTPASNLQKSEKYRRGRKDSNSVQDAMNQIRHRYSALFPLKSLKSSTSTPNVKQTTDFEFIHHDSDRLASAGFQKVPTKSHSQTSLKHPLENQFRNTSSEKDIRSAVSLSSRSKCRSTTSETSIAGEEIFSTSENAIFGRRRSVKRSHSYTEEGKVSEVQQWSPENLDKQSRQRGRAACRSTPLSHKSQSKSRSPNEPSCNGAATETTPLSIRQNRNEQKPLCDESPPVTVNYEDEPSIRRPDRYQSADNFERKDWTIRREPIHAFDQAARRFADIYRDEYVRNISDPSYPTGSYRRAKSMHAISRKYRNSKIGLIARKLNWKDGGMVILVAGCRKQATSSKSPSIDCEFSGSTSTISAHASSGSCRSFDSFLDHCDDDLYAKVSNLPSPHSSFTRRILSESRLARWRQNIKEEHEKMEDQEETYGKSYVSGGPTSDVKSHKRHYF